jgi:hypothetical protein
MMPAIPGLMANNSRLIFPRDMISAILKAIRGRYEQK